MVMQTVLLCATVLLLAGCSATARFSSAIKDAKQTGRPVVIYSVPQNPHSSRVKKWIIVDFINTASQPLQSVTFDIMPYGGGRPVHQAIKGFTAKGPFAPNHAYRFHRPKSDKQKLWPNIEGQYGCPVLVSVIVKKADGSATHIGTSDIARYLTPNVTTACVPAPGTH
jgi:hypothetical protein